VRKLIYMMNTSLDGYIAAPGDDIGWSEPSDELHQWFNDRAREIGLSLYGRKLWELMSAHWPTADQEPGSPPVEVDFAHVWQRTPKVVFSTTLTEVSGNARLVTGDAAAEIARLKTEDGAPMEIGGAGLAGTAMRAGLIDEYQVVTHPVLIGGGTPFFSALDSWVKLRHVETRNFPDGVTMSHYETRR
jgi:dihydrofolate reductase